MNILFVCNGYEQQPIKFSLLKSAQLRNPVTQISTDLTTFLQDTKQAMQDDDLVSLADLMEYEVKPRLDLLGEVLAQFSEIVKPPK